VNQKSHFSPEVFIDGDNRRDTDAGHDSSRPEVGRRIGPVRRRAAVRHV
jgi:hypothetical protein